MRLAEHRSAFRAWCYIAMSGRWKPDVLRPGIIVGMRGSMAIRLRPCIIKEYTPHVIDSIHRIERASSCPWFLPLAKGYFDVLVWLMLWLAYHLSLWSNQGAGGITLPVVTAFVGWYTRGVFPRKVIAYVRVILVMSLRCYCHEFALLLSWVCYDM